MAAYVLSANGLYDPDITGIGHQPMGFDQMMLSYNHYCVLGSSIDVCFRNGSTSTPSIAIRVAPDVTVASVIDSVLEYGLINTDTLDYKGVYGSVKRLRESVSIKKIQGVDNVLDVEVLSGTAAANPVEQTYYHLLVWDTLGITSAVTFDCIIEFTVTFTEPRLLVPSQVKAIKQVLIHTPTDDFHVVASDERKLPARTDALSAGASISCKVV